MNSAARLINEQVYTARWSWSFARTSTYQLCVNLLLISVLISSIAIVYTASVSRSYIQASGHSLSSQHQKQVEYGQLLLEKGTLSAQARIENIAKNNFDMYVPKTTKVIVVNR